MPLPAEFKKYTAGDDGWSDWATPDHESYLMKCCDCGLVHEMSFLVLQVAPGATEDPEGLIEAEPVADDSLHVAFRARRHPETPAPFAVDDAGAVIDALLALRERDAAGRLEVSPAALRAVALIRSLTALEIPA